LANNFSFRNLPIGCSKKCCKDICNIKDTHYSKNYTCKIANNLFITS
jgi:hypothetical protein